MFSLQRPASDGDIPEWLSLRADCMFSSRANNESIFNRTRSNAENYRNSFLFFLPCAAHLCNPAEHCRAPRWADSRSAESWSTKGRPEMHESYMTSGAVVNTKLGDHHKTNEGEYIQYLKLHLWMFLCQLIK